MKLAICIAAVICGTTLVSTAAASPYLPMSVARQQMTKFVLTHLVQRDEAKGYDVRWSIETCWRMSAWRVNCHVRLVSSGTVPQTGDTVTTYCSGTWTAYNDASYFRIRNVTWACN